MLEVQIENIIPVTEARDKFNQIVDAVEGTEELYVLTKNGKPAAIVVGIHHLEKLTGEAHSAVFGSEENAAPAQQTAMPAATAPTETPYTAAPAQVYPTSVAEAAPAPVTDFSAIPQAPVVQPQPPIAPTAPADAISFDSMPAQSAVSPAPVSIPADDSSATLPIDDSPLIDSSAPATGGEAIAPDAVTPDQAGPSADPFAIPSEPLDLPEDAQVQAAPAAPTGQAQ